MVYFAPRGPNDRDPPDLLRFSVTPGAILIRLQNRKAMIGYHDNDAVQLRDDDNRKMP